MNFLDLLKLKKNKLVSEFINPNKIIKFNLLFSTNKDSDSYISIFKKIIIHIIKVIVFLYLPNIIQYLEQILNKVKKTGSIKIDLFLLFSEKKILQNFPSDGAFCDTNIFSF